MKRIIFLILFLLAFIIPVEAQTPTATPTQKFEWSQGAPTLADAQSYTYKYYTSDSGPGTTFTGVICSGTTAPFVCQVAIPAFTPGNHIIKMTATNVAGESAKSPPFDFTFVVTPSVPAGIRIVSGS